MYNAVIDHQNLFLKGVSIMYNEKRSRKSELLQLILLDNLYAQSGSERVIFQGRTALRWVYGGMRFSEDLDFVTDLGGKDIEKILAGTFQQTQRACIAQFGSGQPEHKSKTRRKEAISMCYTYRPETQRERIAVRISPSLFFGFTYHDRFYIASPEKAILDTFYYRGAIPAQDELELDKMDSYLLSKMVNRYPQSASRSLRNLLNLTT